MSSIEQMKLKRVLLVGQAPPREIGEFPFKESGLFRWLSRVGINYEKRREFALRHNQEGVFFVDGKEVAVVKFAALVDFFPGQHKSGGHIAPSREQIDANRVTLQKLITKFSPQIIIPIGKLSIAEALGRDVTLESVVGRRFIASPYGLRGVANIIIPLPHPSGASTWTNLARNKKLLDKALRALRAELE